MHYNYINKLYFIDVSASIDIGLYRLLFLKSFALLLLERLDLYHMNYNELLDGRIVFFNNILPPLPVHQFIFTFLNNK
jgi:hypothetical protein